MTVPVLCALRGARETAVVTALEGAAGRVAVTRRCADLAELLGAAEAGVGRLVVVSDDLPLLDREAVSRLRTLGLRVVALAEGGERATARMHALGVHAVLDAQAPVADVVASVLALADASDAPPDASERADGADGTPDAPRDGAGAGAAWGREDPPLLPDDTPPGRLAHRSGRLVAVWGPTGAPGRTTVAVNLAAELAATATGPEATRTSPPTSRPTSRPTGEATGVLLVDADTYGGTVAQVVGLLDESPGIAAAARAAGHGTLDAAALARLTPIVAPGLRVLTGISRADRWPELPASSLDVVWEVTRQAAAWVVVDCGFCLEQDEALSYDTHAPRRNAATLSALAAADVVVVVGGADAVGIQRLVRGLSELDDCGVASGAERVVVVNRVRASAGGRRPDHAVAEALARYAGVLEPRLVPDDRDGVDGALLRGATLREASPGSPVRAALAGLAAELAGVAHPAGHRRARWRVRSAARA